MGGADLLIDVDALAMLGYAIGELARAPMLGLFNLAALFGAGMLDGGEHFLDFVFRRGGADDEDQIVQTLFHVMTSSFCSRAVARENCLRRRLAALAGLKPGVYMRFRGVAAVVLWHCGRAPFFQDRFDRVARFIQHFCCYFELRFLHWPKDVFPSAV